MSDHGGPRTSVEQVLAALGRHGDRVALTVDDGSAGRVTFPELLGRIHHAAHRLDELGVGRGDVVALLTGDTPATFALRWAVNLLGAAVVVPPVGTVAPVLAEVVATAGVRTVVADAARRSLADTVGDAAGARVVDVPDGGDGPEFPCRARPDDLASVSLTGGTTGAPKGVPRLAAASPAFGPAALASWAGTVQLLCTPVGHFGGTLALQVLAAGGRVVLQPGFDAARALRAIERERVTRVFLLPRLLHRLLDDPVLPGTDTSSLQAVHLGSAPSSARRLGEAVERFGPIVSQGYGTIEARNICWLSAEDIAARPELRSTVGRAMPDVEIAVRDDDGTGLPAGAVGEVWVRSPAVMDGYLGAPEATAAVLREGWVDTGDQGVLDDEGYLTLVGRRRDVVFGGRGRVYPGQVEEVLLRHPGVASAAVVAVRGPEGADGAAECAVAAVVVAAGHDPGDDELAGHVREHLGDASVPSSVHRVVDLPLTPAGKVDRDAVRTMLAATTP